MNGGITSILDGGLGNQMFQYAAGRATSARLGAPLTLDLRRLKKAGARDYALNVFALKQGVKLLTEGEPPEAPRRRYRLLRRLLGMRDYYQEQGFPYDAAILGVSAPVTLDGYFQNDRYFADIADAIRCEFTPRAELKDEIEALAARLLPADTSVSLHVRRGDYVNPATMKVHGLIEPEYYARALRLLEGRIGGKPVVCVFTDDPAWARSHLELPANARFVSEHTHSAVQDLVLMSRCTHHITANSSFSWWGAWLNPNQGKVVVTPREWFRPEIGIDTRDLRPSGWLMI